MNKCKQCDLIIEIKYKYDKKKIFCDSRCAAKYNNQRRVVSDTHKQNTSNALRDIYKKTTSKTPPKQYLCKLCNMPRAKTKQLCDSCRTSKYSCSSCGMYTDHKLCKECKQSIHRNMIFSKIELGTYTGLDTRWLRKYLLSKYGHMCQICKTVEWNAQPIPLVVDHINGRASDNRVDNIRLICPNCDRQLPTFGSKNKNSDRVNRHKKHSDIST